MVSGEGLAVAMRKRLPRPLSYALAALVITANTFNAGADVGGMSAGAHLVLRLPHNAWVVIFGIGLFAMQTWLDYAVISRVFKWLTITLFAYVITAFIVHPPWHTVLLNLAIPHIRLNAGWLATAVGLLGTTITPYLFFWQASLEVEEERKDGQLTVEARRGTDRKAITAMHADVNAGMIFSNVVALFIVITTAATLGAHGEHGIATAQQAAQALAPLAGGGAQWLFAFGMVGTGVLAIPALVCSSAYVAAETFRFREGLGQKPRRARRFYGVIAVGMLIGIAMNLLHVDAIKALFWSAIFNGIAAVPLIVVIVWLASDRKLMGQWRSSTLARAWGWATAILMGLATLAMFYFSWRGMS